METPTRTTTTTELEKNVVKEKNSNKSWCWPGIDQFRWLSINSIKVKKKNWPACRKIVNGIIHENGTYINEMIFVDDSVKKQLLFIGGRNRESSKQRSTVRMQIIFLEAKLRHMPKSVEWRLNENRIHFWGKNLALFVNSIREPTITITFLNNYLRGCCNRVKNENSLAS